MSTAHLWSLKRPFRGTQGVGVAKALEPAYLHEISAMVVADTTSLDVSRTERETGIMRNAGLASLSPIPMRYH